MQAGYKGVPGAAPGTTLGKSPFPLLNVGVNIGRFYAYADKNFTFCDTLQKFDAVTVASSVQMLVDGKKYRARTDPQIVEDIRRQVAELGKKKTYTFATYQDPGHLYQMVTRAGQVFDRASRITVEYGYKLLTTLYSYFMTGGGPVPPNHRQFDDAAFVLDIDGTYRATKPVLSAADVDRAITAYRKGLDPAHERIREVQLGANVIELSHFRVGRHDDIVFMQCLASTKGDQHALDGYAEHRLFIDLRTNDLYFSATGAGRHVSSMIDGANNVLAPFMFHGMAATLGALLELNAARARDGKAKLNLLRGGDAARQELLAYIREHHRDLARDIALARLLDYLSRPIQGAKYFLGAGTSGAPTEPDDTGGSGADSSGHLSLAAPLLVIMLTHSWTAAMHIAPRATTGVPFSCRWTATACR